MVIAQTVNPGISCIHCGIPSVIEAGGNLAYSSPHQGIREIAEKGDPQNADHTLKNVDSFRQWEDNLRQAAKKKLYYPQLNDTVIDSIRCDA